MFSRSFLAPLRSLLPAVVLGGATLLLAVPGCGRQTEGERCDIAAGRDGADSDCDDGLVCTAAKELGTSSDICCPESGATEPACIPLANPVGSGGAGGGTASTGGAGGMSAGGSGGSTNATGGSAAGGSAAGGSANGGSATGGNSAGGSATGGSAAGGNTGGNATGGAGGA